MQTINHLVSLYTAARNRAAEALEVASRNLRNAGTGPLATRYAEEMNAAFDKFSAACDALRFVDSLATDQPEVATR